MIYIDPMHSFCKFISVSKLYILFRFALIQSIQMHSRNLKYTLKEFHNLGIYSKMSTPSIFNLMFCNRVMSFPLFVSNATLIYKFSCRILPPRLVDFVIKQTFCRALTAGTTLSEANIVSEYFRKDNISIILDFCAEGDINEKDNEIMNDQNAKMFALSADNLSQKNDEMISIKITGLLKMQLLQKFNKAVERRDKFWEQNSSSGLLNGRHAFNGFKKIIPDINESTFQKYLFEIHGHKQSIDEFSIDEVGFKMNHYPYFLDEPHKNTNQVIKRMFPLEPSQRKSLNNFKLRVMSIADPHATNQNGFKILVDAEQSYVQKAIEVISEQLQHKYNKKQLYFIPTIQNYLKTSVSRAKYQIEIAKRRNLIFGAKLVRGAYLVEESKLAEANKTENPVVSSFQQTTQNYMESFRLMAQSFSEGEIIVASHNINTMDDTAEIAKQLNSKMRISYAQLMGLADHLTYKANSLGYRVYKYLPWAGTSTMVPYMIRRAQELSQMKYPLNDQFALLKLELKNRFW